MQDNKLGLPSFLVLEGPNLSERVQHHARFYDEACKNSTSSRLGKNHRMRKFGQKSHVRRYSFRGCVVEWSITFESYDRGSGEC